MPKWPQGIILVRENRHGPLLEVIDDSPADGYVLVQRVGEVKPFTLPIEALIPVNTDAHALLDVDGATGLAKAK